MPGYEVITEALRAESKRWHKFADDVEPIVRDVTSARLGVSAFFIGDPALTPADATVHQSVYEDYRDMVQKVFESAVTELDELGQALVKAANQYDRLEKIVDLDLNTIYTN